jgi:succinate dehydrogenase / fumarate reductase cytochrome b subunit
MPVDFVRGVVRGSSAAAFSAGLGVFPAWFVKLVALALIWAYLHHLLAGVRHLWTWTYRTRTTKTFGRSIGGGHLRRISVLLTLVLGAKLFGLY